MGDIRISSQQIGIWLGEPNGDCICFCGAVFSSYGKEPCIAPVIGIGRYGYLSFAVLGQLDNNLTGISWQIV